MSTRNVRIVCAGSIGFHRLRHDEVEVAAALNDLHAIPVRPLARPDAIVLARRLRARLRGLHHRKTLVDRENFAHWTGAAGDPAAARDLYRDIAADCLRTLGPLDRTGLNARGGHARWTGEAGDAETARDLLRALAGDGEAAFGPDHADTLRARHGAAHWAAVAGDRTTAIAEFLDVLQARCRVLGAEHPTTTLGADRLGRLISEGADAPELVNALASEGHLRFPLPALKLLVAAAVYALARTACQRFLDDPTEGRALLGDWLSRLSRGPGLALVVALLVVIDEEPREGAEGVVIDALVNFDAIEILVPALAAACEMSVVSPEVLLPRWLAAMAERPEPSLDLAKRIMTAAVALLAGSEEPLVSLPAGERVLVRAAAGLTATPPP